MSGTRPFSNVGYEKYQKAPIRLKELGLWKLPPVGWKKELLLV
jgi:hypothetical protein